MSLRQILLATVVLTLGCANRSYNVADPVVGPAPPRIRNTEQYVAAQSPESEIVQTGWFEPGEVIPMTGVVARVNGNPILAGEVLEQYIPSLMAFREKNGASDAEFRKAQEQVLQKQLPALIEQKIMVDAIKSKMKKEQLEAVDQQLDRYFEMQVQEMKTKAGVETVADLEAVLQGQGMSLATMRKMFGDNQLAMEYVKSQIKDQPQPTRQELLAEYEQRKSEFEEPAQVKWQQLQVSLVKHGPEVAQQRIQQAQQEYLRGESFDAIVQKYSDGPTASTGGHWDWMQPESIALPALRTAIESVEVGAVSGVIDTRDSLQLILVHGRQPRRFKPLSSVQQQLSKEITERNREAAGKAVIAKLKDRAVIETIFDEQASGETKTGRKMPSIFQ